MNASDGVLIFGGVTMLLLTITFLLGTETYLLARGRAPITTYTRAVVRDWPGPALTVVGVVIFVIGLLSAHFVWDVSCG